MSFFAPQNFDDENKENALIKHDLHFQSLCDLMEDNGVFEPKRLTAFEFLSKVSFLEKKFKPKK